MAERGSRMRAVGRVARERQLHAVVLVLAFAACGLTACTTPLPTTPGTCEQLSPLPVNGPPAGAAQALRLFHDFRTLPDGDVPASTNGYGTDDPSPVIDINDHVPAYFQPATVRGGALTPSLEYTGTATGVGLSYPLAGPLTGRTRISFCHGGYAASDGPIPAKTPTLNLALVDGSASGPILHVAPSGPNETTFRLGNDVNGASIIAPADEHVIPRAIVDGDIIGFEWDGLGGTTGPWVWTVFLNNEPVASYSGSPYNPATRTVLAAPVGSAEQVWGNRLRWLAIADGHFDPTTWRMTTT